MPPPPATDEKPSSGRSKRTLTTPAENTEAPSSPTSPRPPAAGPLGGKSAECFAWSARHDDDAEFLRRYAGDPKRVAFMLAFHAADAALGFALDRLKKLIQ